VNDESAQHYDGNDNYYNYNYNISNLSSLSVADVHVTTLVSLQQHVTSAGHNGEEGEEAEFEVGVNQSRYELYQPLHTSRDVIVYVIQLVCVKRIIY